MIMLVICAVAMLPLRNTTFMAVAIARLPSGTDSRSGYAEIVITRCILAMEN